MNFSSFRKVTEWYVTIICSVVFTICAIFYFTAIQGLQKPAGMIQAIELLFSSPKEYALCLLCGAGAKITFAIMMVSSIVSVVRLILAVIYRDDGYSGEIRIKEILLCIVNIVIAVVMGTFQAKMISYFWILVITIVVLLIGLKAWADNT